ncbi:hypothetical protein ACJMK2_008679 [Sinanodonta woodiana]|uniref:Uncharacterized protein n=1 Tax=Sinanodonta woodiana TaxID=1069815 RepID=A0ABD3VN37_SINWO
MLRTICQRVPLYIDIGDVRTIKIISGLLGFSLLLQIITFTTPGWRVYKNEEKGKEEYMALMYDVRCDSQGCKTYAVSEDEYKKGQPNPFWICPYPGTSDLCPMTVYFTFFTYRQHQDLPASQEHKKDYRGIKLIINSVNNKQNLYFFAIYIRKIVTECRYFFFYCNQPKRS